jgi:precorrin-3B synthase
MMSGDGLIVRVRAASKPLRSAQLRAIAALASEHGAGVVELTRRANLQLRGLTERALPEVRRILVELGLAAPTAELEHRLSLFVHPLAGLDAACVELAPLAAAVERALVELKSSPALPAKFGIIIESDIETLDGPAFIRLRVNRGARLQVQIGIAYEYTRAAEWIGVCGIEDAPQLVCQLVQLAAPSLTWPAMNVVRAQLSPWLWAEPLAPPPPPRAAPTWLGHHVGVCEWFGCGIGLGSATATTWFGIAELADRFGRGELRMAPGRTVLIPAVLASDSARVRKGLQSLGLIVSADDPLSYVDACVGAPACASAAGDTRQLARSLATALSSSLGPQARLHVSGCSKSCAHSGPSRITVLREPGGCKVGRDVDTHTTAQNPLVSLEAAQAELADSPNTRPSRS